MKGRIIAWLIIGFIGIPLLLFFGTALVLFLAPGFEIFGIRYVANGVVDYKKEIPLSSFGGELYINAYDAPIEIEYAGVSAPKVVFKQKYVGFTRTPDKQPSIKAEVDANGDLRISTVEIRKFIFASSITDSYLLYVMLPQNSRDITINAETSSVTFKGVVGNASRVNVTSKGKFNVQNTMKIGTLNLNTNSDVNLDTNLTLTHATISTGNKYINIKNAVTGDLNLKNTSGNIQFNRCQNLTVNTSSGVVKSSVAGGAVVNGNAKITTRSGSVNLESINGTDTSTITTKTGTINIKKLNYIDITSNRGNINIGETTSVKIKGGSGDISIAGVNGKVTISATSGSVVLGAENGNVIQNPVVNTTTGKIYAYNTMGNVSLTSTHNLIHLKNKNASQIRLSAGRTLTAKNLQGDVNAYANGNVNLHFQNLKKDVTINVGTKCKSVKIDAKCAIFDEVNYQLKSSKNKAASVYKGDTLLVRSNPINATNGVAAPLIKVTGAYQVTTLYLGE